MTEDYEQEVDTLIKRIKAITLIRMLIGIMIITRMLSKIKIM